MTDAERQAALEAIAAEIRGCTRCRLHQGRTNSVPGEGSASTEVMFVGEGPGFNEDRQGRPFVGRAGEKLTDWIRSIGWRRQDVFITNVVKCRPPDNRDPMPDEIAACTPFLRRQLEALDPAVIVTLGRFSMGWVMPGTKITQVHGTARLADPATGVPEATAYAMYHPAAALRSPEVDRQAADDMFGVPLALIAARERRARAAAERGEAHAADAGAEPAPAEVQAEMTAAVSHPLAVVHAELRAEGHMAPAEPENAAKPGPASREPEEPALEARPLAPGTAPETPPAGVSVDSANIASASATFAEPASPEPPTTSPDPPNAAPEPPPIRRATPPEVPAHGPQPDDGAAPQLTLF